VCCDEPISLADVNTELPVLMPCEIHNILTAEQVRTLHQHVDPFMEDGNFGVNVYLLAVDVVSALCGL